jgi:hypothetical protein
MFVRQLGCDASAGGAIQEPDLDQERFVDFFNRVLLLGQGRGQRVHAHRSALIFLDDREQKLSIHFVEAMTIDLQHLQRGLRSRQVDFPRAANLGKVPYPAQQTVGDARSPTRAAGNFERPGVVDLDPKNFR